MSARSLASQDFRSRVDEPTDSSPKAMRIPCVVRPERSRGETLSEEARTSWFVRRSCRRRKLRRRGHRGSVYLHRIKRQGQQRVMAR